MIASVCLNPAVDCVMTFDRFECGRMNSLKSIQKTAGGKGVNVARVLKQLGVPVRLIGFAGGRLLADLVEQEGISAQWVMKPEETRVHYQLTDHDGNLTEMVEPSAPVSAEETEKFLTLYEETLRGCEWVVLSGSLPPGVPASFYKKLIVMAKERGIPALLDTSGEALKEGLTALPYGVKPNEEEARAIGLLEQEEGYPPLTLVSLGERGAWLKTPEKTYRLTPPSVRVKNPVGSGDAMVAGVAAGLYRKQTVLEAVRLGMACGVANTNFLQPGTVTQPLVAQYYQQIQVEESTQWSL